MKKTKIIKIKDIVWDKSIYPRASYVWQTALTYKNAMKTGSIFPPITVALYKRNYILVDGKHRVEAFRMAKEKFISAEILRGLNKNQMYIQSIKRNTQHGLPLNVYEKSNIIIKLEDINYTLPQISKIINLPVREITSFKVNRITSDITGKDIALKPQMLHLAGKTINLNGANSIQEHYRGNSQIGLINELNSLLKYRLIDIKNKSVFNNLKILYKSLIKYKSIIK